MLIILIMKWFNFSIYLTFLVTSLKYNNFFRSIQQDNLSNFTPEIYWYLSKIIDLEW